MRVISVTSGKGGVGKTTLASALAVRAAQDNKGKTRVAMVDLDPLGSLAGWWKRRGSTDNPQIYGNADTATDAVEALMLNEAFDYCFIDTPPAFMATMQDAIENADLALVPLRPSSLDLIGSEDAVIMAREANTPYLCVINDAEPSWKTTNSARDYLLAAGEPVAETIITHRAAYLGAMSMGKSGPEIEKPKRKCDTPPAAQEISTLWAEVKAALAKSKGSRHDR
jgi:chromosome partitioning protein